MVCHVWLKIQRSALQALHWIRRQSFLRLLAKDPTPHDDGLTLWRCGDVEVWRCGDVKMWKCEDVEMWRCGDVEMWRCGDVE